MLSFEDYQEDVRQDRYFSYTKINHGFWERLIRIRELASETLDIATHDHAQELDAKTGTPCFLATGFVNELFELIAGIESLPGDFRFAASPYAWPACRRIFGVPFSGLREVEKEIERYIPRNIRLEDGIFWKTATIDGSIVAFYETLNKKRVVLVGPKWLAQFGTFVGLDDFTFVEIDARAARCEREKILHQLLGVASNLEQKPTVILFQGGPVATWLILKLHGKLQCTTMIDMGVALNICSIPTVFRQDWGRFFRGGIARTIQRIHPGWEEKAEAYFGINDRLEQRKIWQRFSSGIDEQIAEVAGLPARLAYDPDFDLPPLDGLVTAIEPKKIDFKRVEEILEFAGKKRNGSDFSPVSGALERALEHVMGVLPNRKVIMCSNATDALFALAGLHSFKLGRPARIVASSFGVKSSVIGPLADTITLIDCDEQGLLDLGLLSAIPIESYDAVLVTNVYGLSTDFPAYKQFCKANNKLLLVDNAPALAGFIRNNEDAPDEIISLNHEHPFGVGVGGCVVVSREDEEIVRKFLGFGVGLPFALGAYATEGKMSEYSSALILERLERYPVWSTYYQAQFSRILRLAKNSGLEIFGSPNSEQAHAQLPLLAPFSLDENRLQKGAVPLHKSYKPLLENGAPMSASLFSRAFSISTHSGMAAMPTDMIFDTFCNIQKGKISVY